MIIKVRQIASNVKQDYLIEGEDFSFRADAGSFSPRQAITLLNDKTEIKGEYSRSHWTNYLPFRHIFSVSLTRHFDIIKDGAPVGFVLLSRHGMYKSFYMIALSNDEILHCHHYAKDSFCYESIYKDGKQIALIEIFLSNDSYKYLQKIYLLDEYSRFFEILSFFAVYYASYELSKRFHMSGGSVHRKTFYFRSGYKDKYDPLWRETHFPNENFFGKIHI